VLSPPHAKVDNHEVLLFDGLAYPDPFNSSETSLYIQAFAFRQIFASLTLPAAREVVKGDSGAVGAGRDHVIEERLRLFFARGVPYGPLTIDVTGCSLPAIFQKAVHGRFVSNAGLGRCGLEGERLIATVVGETNGVDAPVQASVFSAPNAGYGVISDVDDTVKQSFVLDKRRLIKATFVDEPKPVQHMPELYASLSHTLAHPQFVYITGSPFQLYPFLRSFIYDTYPTAKGPILTRELDFSLTNPARMLGFLDHDNLKNFKLEAIGNLTRFYPQKRWLAIGDSGEKDPEIYGAAYRNHPDSIACIWIRRVEGAMNDPERFLQAFRGVPQDRYKVFDDSEIPSLARIDVRRGCV